MENPEVDPDEATAALFQALFDAEKTLAETTELSSSTLTSLGETQAVAGRQNGTHHTTRDLFANGAVAYQPNPDAYHDDSQTPREKPQHWNSRKAR
jgi:hypothetical protein